MNLARIKLGALVGAYDVKGHKIDLENRAKAPEVGGVADQVLDDENGLAVRWERALIKRAEGPARPMQKGRQLCARAASGQVLGFGAASHFHPQRQQLAA